MPLVYINLMEGRPPEKIEKMISAVSQAISTSLDAPIDSVRVMVYEMQPHQYGVAGKPWSQIKAEREAQAKSQTT